MRLRLALALLILTGCSGNLIVEVGQDGSISGPACVAQTDCLDGFICSDGQCVLEGSGSNNNNNGDNTPTAEIGETCTSAFECISGRCEAFGDASVCTETCSDLCDNGLVCFENRCVPSDYCEDSSGNGFGPGCNNSVCQACDPNADCIPGATGFACQCKEGFQGPGTTCEEILCLTNQCLNGGTCVAVNGEESCSCADDDGDSLPDWTGDLCETALENCPIFVTAQNDPCDNGGECVNQADGLVCNCAGTGYTGDSCDVDIDECASANPCENGGVCENEMGGFDCDCPTGFTGETCSIDVSGGCTMTNPCENGGVCSDVPSGVECDCAGTGFTGDVCSVNIDDCSPNPCVNGGSCVDGINAFTCDCPAGFAGTTCADPAPCANDLECAGDQFCDPVASTCQADTCDPDEDRMCDGNTVLQCAPNGRARDPLFTCTGRGDAFASTCETPASGDAYCTCEDDWDCPANTECNVDRCVGTGEPATCRLPAEPFANVLPTNEIEWGSAEGIANDASRLAPEGTPFREFTQVVMTPSVANLDDDNGDGVIDERDFPEIIFLTFCWPIDGRRDFSDFTRDGVLRVIHGGGPEKGEDYMAICGDNVWRDDGTGVGIDAACDCDINSSNGQAVADNGSGADQPRFDPTMSPAIADLDGDGTPEILVHNESDQVEVYDNRGNLLTTSRGQNNVGNGAITVANIDNDGLAEVILGRNVNKLEVNGNAWEFTDYFRGNGRRGSISQGPAACVADILGDEQMEIIGGSTVYRIPEPPAGITMQSEISEDCNTYSGDAREFCEEDLVTVWDGGEEGFCAIADVWGADENAPPSATNPLDGVPEVVLIGSGRNDVNGDGSEDNAGGWLTVYRGAGDGGNAVVIEEIDYDTAPFNLGNRGGAPNVDDFDGDGFPEVGTAFSAGYAVTDFQATSTVCPQWTTRLDSDPAILAGSGDDPNPDRTPSQVSGGCTADSQCEALAEGTTCNEQTGECICLYNNWIRRTEDNSSRLTGSSVFDFNGDGAAEVVYNDECEFRVYDGINGNVLFNEFSESRTRIEYPVVADVDNDGNAEIVFGTSNESGFCSDNNDSRYNAGVEVWGDAGDFWVSARRMWNQHAYHVTNITENNQVPRVEPKGWEDTNGRFYNTYRSNPRNFGVAPDLEVTAVQVVSGGGGCGGSGGGGNASIVSQITNIGDLRVGPGVVVGFQGDFGSGLVTLLGMDGTPLRITVSNTLEPRDSVFLTTEYDPAWNGETELPSQVRVVVDASYDEIAMTMTFDGGAERECDEDNNDRTVATVGSVDLPDAQITQVSAPTVCSSFPTVTITVANTGSQPLPAGTVVRVYAGDPNQGGTALRDLTLSAALPAGATTNLTQTLNPFPQCSPVRIFAEVDPGNAVEECNDGNNQFGRAVSTNCCGGGGG
ncbi:MAG: FG-GAP-like repeat-containing protein [Myxococcota bacterium]